jgi:hypothetical protein
MWILETDCVYFYMTWKYSVIRCNNCLLLKKGRVVFLTVIFLIISNNSRIRRGAKDRIKEVIVVEANETSRDFALWVVTGGPDANSTIAAVIAIMLVANICY